VLVAAACVRLGFWQLSRLAEKQALNARLRTALAAPAEALPPYPPQGAPSESLETARFLARGRFDERYQILLVNRVHGGEPGVEIITPLKPEDGSWAILVNRGWVPAADAATANPADYPVPGVRTVVGLLTPIPPLVESRVIPIKPDPGVPPPPDSGGVKVWSTARLDYDWAMERFPYNLNPALLRELAAPGDSALPARAEARLHDETIHQSYAAQWFLFGAIALVGPFLLLRRRSRRP
jgi:surfeit locus 1 family protein